MRPTAGGTTPLCAISPVSLHATADITHQFDQLMFVQWDSDTIIVLYDLTVKKWSSFQTGNGLATNASVLACPANVIFVCWKWNDGVTERWTSIYLSVCLSSVMSVCLSVYQSLFFLCNLSVVLSIYLSNSLSSHLSTISFIHLSTFLCVYLLQVVWQKYGVEYLIYRITVQTCNITNGASPLTISLKFHDASHLDIFLDSTGYVYITGVGRFDRLCWLIFRLWMCFFMPLCDVFPYLLFFCRDVVWGVPVGCCVLVDVPPACRPPRSGNTPQT